MRNEHTSPGAYYRRWLRYIAKDHPTLNGLNRGMLLAFAWTFADKGDNGLSCFAGNGPISDQLECTRDTVGRYKSVAIDAGWFVDTGRKVRRSKVYNISIPSREPEPYKRVARKWTNLGTARPSQTLSELPSGTCDCEAGGYPTHICELAEPLPIVPGDPWG